MWSSSESRYRPSTLSSSSFRFHTRLPLQIRTTATKHIKAQQYYYSTHHVQVPATRGLVLVCIDTPLCHLHSLSYVLPNGLRISTAAAAVWTGALLFVPLLETLGVYGVMLHALARQLAISVSLYHRHIVHLFRTDEALRHRTHKARHLTAWARGACTGPDVVYFYKKYTSVPLPCVAVAAPESMHAWHLVETAGLSRTALLVHSVYEYVSRSHPPEKRIKWKANATVRALLVVSKRVRADTLRQGKARWNWACGNIRTRVNAATGGQYVYVHKWGDAFEPGGHAYARHGVPHQLQTYAYGWRATTPARSIARWTESYHARGAALRVVNSGPLAPKAVAAHLKRFRTWQEWREMGRLRPAIEYHLRVHWKAYVQVLAELKRRFGRCAHPRCTHSVVRGWPSHAHSGHARWCRAHQPCACVGIILPSAWAQLARCTS